MSNRPEDVIAFYYMTKIITEVRKYRPEMLDEEIFEALKDGRVKITPARTSNWPVCQPMIPPKVEFKEETV